MGYPAVYGGCTPESPRIAVPGSGAHFLNGAWLGFRWMHLAEIEHPADVTNVREASRSASEKDGIIYMANGCESRHFSGQNMVFMDGHAKYIVGNPSGARRSSAGRQQSALAAARCQCARYMASDK